MKKFFLNKNFLIGILFVVVLLFLSSIYTLYLSDSISNPPNRIYDKDHHLLDVPPYSPSTNFILGVDRYGEDIFWKVIDGSKYTILIALIVSFLRVIISTFCGIIYSLYLYKWNILVDPFIRAFRFIPTVILTMIFFLSINIDNTVSDFSVVLNQVFILIFVAVVPLTNVIATEVNEYSKNEFILCAKSIGARKRWIIRKHILPYMRPRVFILLAQQTVQTLLLLVHLGIFQFLIGRAKEYTSSDGIGSTIKISLSLSNEWSGLIGLSYRELMLDQWILVGPCIGFILTIFSFRLIGMGIQQVLDEQPKQFYSFGSLSINRKVEILDLFTLVKRKQ